MMSMPGVRWPAYGQTSKTEGEADTMGSTSARYLVMVHHPANAGGAPSCTLLDAPYPHPEIAMERAVQELTERTTPLGPGCYVWVIPWDAVDAMGTTRLWKAIAA